MNRCGKKKYQINVIHHSNYEHTPLNPVSVQMSSGTITLYHILKISIT